MIIKRKTIKTSRSYKVSELIRKAISEVLVRNEMPLDSPFKFPISVVKVEMNSDLKIAYIYVITHEKIEENASEDNNSEDNSSFVEKEEFSAEESESSEIDDEFNQETEEELLDIPTFLRRQAN